MKKTYRLTIELGNHDFDTGQISMDQQHLLDSFIKQLKNENRQKALAFLRVRNIEEAGEKVMEDEIKALESQKSERLALLEKSKSKRTRNNLLADIKELEDSINKLKKSQKEKEEEEE